MAFKIPEDQWPLVIGTAVASIVATVLVLDIYGYLQHSKPDDALIMEGYHSRVIEPGDGFQISPKSSGVYSLCIQGYLFLQPEDDSKASRILLDSRNRGIACRSM